MLEPPNEPTTTTIRKRARRGGRSYHGCSICRLRKIKCDGRQPTCHNCERSRRYICDGYQGRESRKEDHVPEDEQTPPEQQFEDGILEDDTIERLLRQSADCSVPHDIQQYGTWPTQLAESDASEGMQLLAPAGEGWLGSANYPFDTPQDFNFVDGILPWDFQPNNAARAALQTSAKQQSQCRLLVTKSTGSKRRSRAEETALPPRISQPAHPRENLAITPFEISEHATQLLDHYRTHVSQLMMPTSAPSSNPWLRLYLPIALQEPQTRAKRCLLYGLLAVAAFNKANLPKADDENYRQQARNFKEKASNILNDMFNPLPKMEDFDQSATERHALLAAVLTMTTVEVFSGEEQGQGYENILLAKRIIQLTGGLQWWLSDASSLTLFQIFRCLQLVAFTSGWIFPPSSNLDELGESSGRESPGNDDTHVDELVSSQDLANQYTLDVSFGVSMKTMRCLNRIVELSSAKAKASGKHFWPRSHQAEILRLEEDLFGVLDDPTAFCGQQLGNPHQGMSSYVSEEIKENHIWAFHYSTAIYYRRAICDGRRSLGLVAAELDEFDRISNKYTGQNLVSKALEHLENVDALSSDIPLANTLWPGFIAAVEAVDMELRHRALIWFARAKRHGIGNIAKAKALVMEVWRRVDRHTWVDHDRRNILGDLSHVDWREVMREKGMFIMLT